jgi:DNA-directed RNA polymerase II subunit RPB2
MDEEIVWDIIDKHFKENPQSLVRHHIESFNDFYKHGIYKLFKEKNPITIVSKYDESIGEYRSKCNLYIGGKNGDLVYIAKPVIYDSNAHYMFPNEARLRNMTYAMTIHVDVELEFIDILEKDEVPHINVEPDPNADPVERQEPLKNYKATSTVDENTGLDLKGGASEYYENDPTDGQPYMSGGAGGAGENKKKIPAQMTPNERAILKETLEKSVNAQNVQTRHAKIEKVFFGKFPIMVQSDFCVLAGLPREMRFNMGECRNDLGGYFIIDGKEKTVVPQETFGDNMLRVNKVDSDSVLYTAEIKSVSENTSKPIRTLSVDLVAPSGRYSNMNIVVNIPNVRKPVPLFIVFRALGIVTDKHIVEMCLLESSSNSNGANGTNSLLQDLFIPSVHDAGPIMTQTAAIHFIAHLTKTKTNTNALHILTDYFLPHIGETNYIEKAYFLGYMVKRIIMAYQGMELPIDRDSFRYKRVELVGALMYKLFREYYKMQMKHIHVSFEKKLYYNLQIYENDLHGLINTNYKTVFGERIVEEGFRKAFKGNWGATEHTKIIGVVQDLNRLSFNSALSHLRKTNLSVNAGGKLVGPRVLNGSQWGLVDPIDTPDGGNIGLHKQLCIMTQVSRGVSREPMVKWLKEKCDLRSVEECGINSLSKMTKVMVNGYWAGVTNAPQEIVEKFKIHRRNGLIPIFISICFESRTNTISIFTDEGRLCRPIFYYDNDLKHMSFNSKIVKDGSFSWLSLLNGSNKRRIEDFVAVNSDKFYELHELYDGIDNGETNPHKLKRFIDNKGIIDYIDPNEEETALICLNFKGCDTDKKYTHCEIHESLIFGMMCNLVIYPHHNPATRNSFSTGQSKQAVSMYHTNFSMRMDKTSLILNQGQKPLVKSRYLEHICQEENSYGENAIVALMCYTGYNVEDAVLINEGAIQRGLFRTTYFSVYETHEEKTTVGGVTSSKKFLNVGADETVKGLKAEHDYSKLDKHGLVKEGTEMNDRTIIIGCAHSVPGDASMHDSSKTTKKGQLGIVDKTYITEGEEGTKIAKVRIREERLPAIGDKMASRSGQKGTIGQIIPERDMPFTKDGLKPDIIVNPHAMPTRMTVGQLVECLVGKACLNMGYHGDCTAFTSTNKQIGEFGKVLNACNFHSSGNELLYNGMTGEQLEAEVYIGPNYYMRLKHMVKDKVNYRAKGPRTQLTRQPVSGRANDGGLRIGEMERDVLIAHGVTDFLRESMLDRGDQYYMAICNKTGAIAIYNPDKNLFMSPMADGPLKYVESLDGKEMNVEHITKYGRDFSVVRVPYVFKLLMHELQTINVKMCIITEDNINQFDNMNFSKNISLLTNGEAMGPEDVISKVKRILSGKVSTVEEPEIEELKELDEILSKPPTEMKEPVEYDNWEIFQQEDKRAMEEYYRRRNDPDYEVQGTAGFKEPFPGNESYVSMSGGKGANANVEDTDAHTVGTTPLQVNDIVIFKGDFKPDRKWLIRKITGEFAKIETNDYSGGLDPENATNIVNLYDLKKADSLIPEPNAKPVGQLVPMGGATPQVSSAQTQQPLQINVVTTTGNNNKLSELVPAAIETVPMIRKPNTESSSLSTTPDKSVSFDDVSLSMDGGNTIDNIPTGTKSGPIIVKKV